MYTEYVFSISVENYLFELSPPLKYTIGKRAVVMFQEGVSKTFDGIRRPFKCIQNSVVHTQEVHNARGQITHEQLANKAGASLMGEHT